jgi:hypothetical protein
LSCRFGLASEVLGMLLLMQKGFQWNFSSVYLLSFFWWTSLSPKVHFHFSRLNLEDKAVSLVVSSVRISGWA